jgi:hypothetical protein
MLIGSLQRWKTEPTVRPEERQPAVGATCFTKYSSEPIEGKRHGDTRVGRVLAD